MPDKALMNLRILLPFCIFTEKTGVSRIIAETIAGSLGIFPHRLDCVSALYPGILVYEIGTEGETYLAIDKGLLIKNGFDVLITVRNAVRATNLEQLYETVENDFMVLNESQKRAREVMSKIEKAFIQRIATFHHG